MNNEWQPIETAPKDGATILLWEKFSEYPFVGHWNHRWIVNKDFICVYDGYTEDNVAQSLVTHWQPLPGKPEDLI